METLPQFELRSGRELSDLCLQRGLSTFQALAEWVKALSYARPSQPGLAAVLLEARGTCSTKHALLAAIAAEHGIQGMQLCLGI